MSNLELIENNINRNKNFKINKHHTELEAVSFSEVKTIINYFNQKNIKVIVTPEQKITKTVYKLKFVW